MFDELMYQIFSGYTDPIMIAQCFLLAILLLDAFISLFGAIFSIGGRRKA